MARQQNFAEDGDLFKKLPDSIVHHILHFLGLKDYSRLSCVSRRYRELCVSTPWVTLNNTNLTPRRFLFNNFVDRLLCRRCWHGVKIQNFILIWDFGEFFENEAYRIDTWFYHVVNLGVQKISIQLTTTRFALPQCVLNCKTMVFLKIMTKDGILKLPSTSSAAGFGINTTLQTLVLISVRIEDINCFGEWLSQFKSLKVLNLTRVSGIKSMSIHNSSIDVLAIKYCDDLVDITIFAEKLRKLLILWYPHNKSSSVGSLKILAPNLEDFRWGVGHVVDYYCIEDFSSKLNLIIALGLSDQLYESSTKYYLHKILRSMQRAKVLTLRDEFVEVNILYSLPFPNHIHSFLFYLPSMLISSSIKKLKF